MNKRKTGAGYEEYAARYLQAAGCRILERNFRCRQGEIDIIAWDPAAVRPCLIFVEVKYRKDARTGHPEEAVTAQKQRAILSAAEFYLVRNHIDTDVPCRFDVIAIEGGELRHIPDAFQAG